MTELLLGLDIGTASSKGVLCTPDGTIVARASHRHDAVVPRPGWLEHDAEAAWWGGIRALCAELLAGRRDAVRGVAVSGIGPCLLPCDASGRPLRHAILYGTDVRSESEVAELTTLLGAEAIRKRGGSALSTQALGPKLLWLRRHEQDVWERTARWHMASTFVVERLTGAWILDQHSASQCDPFYDLDGHAWAEDWWEETLGSFPLPSLAWPGEVVGTVHERGAEATGLPVGVPVAAGTIDAWAEALSAGVRRPGETMVMYGSTMFFIVVAEAHERATASGVWTTTGIDPDTRALAAGTATSGAVSSWLAELVGADHGVLVEEARTVPPGARGLLLVPAFSGERTPVADPSARGVLAGLTLAHGRAELYRAVLEGTAYAARLNLDELGVQSPMRAVSVGGGAATDLWPQIVADVTGIAQVLPRETIGACFGDARLAAESVGLAETGGSWAEDDRVLEPDPARRHAYDQLFAQFLSLQRQTLEIQHALADIQAGDAPSA